MVYKTILIFFSIINLAFGNIIYDKNNTVITQIEMDEYVKIYKLNYNFDINFVFKKLYTTNVPGTSMSFTYNNVVYYYDGDLNNDNLNYSIYDTSISSSILNTNIIYTDLNIGYLTINNIAVDSNNTLRLIFTNLDISTNIIGIFLNGVLETPQPFDNTKIFVLEP